MPYIPPEVVEQARQIDLLTYLQSCEPQELVRISGNNYTTRTHDAIPLWEKANLTVYEAAAYSGIGADKLRELSDREDCEFVLWNGTKRLIKRKKLDEFLERAYSI